MPTSEECKFAFKDALKALHNQCLYSNIMYLISAFFAFFLLSGWWRLLGVYILLISMVSYIHHSQKKAGVSVQFWNTMDTVLAFALFVFGTFVVISFSKNASIRESIGTGLLSVNFIIGMYSIGIFILSRIAAAKTKIENNADDDNDNGNTEGGGWGGIYSPILYQKNQVDTTSSPAAVADDDSHCDDQRYETDYLAIHSTWHSLSGISILITIIIIQNALKSGFSFATPTTTAVQMPA